jgi:hypothetical protein
MGESMLGRHGTRIGILVVFALAIAGTVGASVAGGERTQYGTLIVSLDGGFSPLKLHRDRPTPVAVRLEGGLATSDRKPLPRVTRVELQLPTRGILSTRGLPRCTASRLRNAREGEALAECGRALVARGALEADMALPHMEPFRIHGRLLAFNTRLHGRPALLVHVSASNPPTVLVLPFVIRRRGGGLGTALAANLAPSLGPWPRLAHFEMTLFRRYRSGGHRRSYLSASCPIPRYLTAGFVSFARLTFTLAGGQRVSTSITRGCRAPKW